MAILKATGDTWGASISFDYKGPPLVVDVGVCVHLDQIYRWLSFKNFTLIAVPTWTRRTAHMIGIWSSGGLAEGRTIGTQLCVCPAGLMPQTNEETAKMTSNLSELTPYIQDTDANVYVVEGESPPPPPPDGVQLYQGYNKITYMGAFQSTKRAVEPIENYLDIIWWQSDTGWASYVPGSGDNDLVYLWAGMLLDVTVTADCFWSW